MTHHPCDKCSSFDFSCTGACNPKKFGVRLRITRIKVPAWVGGIHRRSLDADHPESIENWVRQNLGIEPEEWMTR